MPKGHGLEKIEKHSLLSRNNLERRIKRNMELVDVGIARVERLRQEYEAELACVQQLSKAVGRDMAELNRQEEEEAPRRIDDKQLDDQYAELEKMRRDFDRDAKRPGLKNEEKRAGNNVMYPSPKAPESNKNKDEVGRGGRALRVRNLHSHTIFPPINELSNAPQSLAGPGAAAGKGFVRNKLG